MKVTPDIWLTLNDIRKPLDFQLGELLNDRWGLFVSTYSGGRTGTFQRGVPTHVQLEGQVRKQQAVEQEDGLCDTEDGESVAETSDDEDYQASLPDLLSPSDTDDEDYDSDATQIEASSPRVRTVRGGRKPPKMGCAA